MTRCGRTARPDAHFRYPSHGLGEKLQPSELREPGSADQAGWGRLTRCLVLPLMAIDKVQNIFDRHDQSNPAVD